MLEFKIHAYYYAKRLIPRSFQIAVRRKLVMYKLRKHASSWPMHESVENLPQDWTGWPQDKQFALVLTHDIETARGVDSCLRLADLEENLGFRSVFNFVAEEYRVPYHVREELTRRGFEIGVHGLYHNSSLFLSRKEFLRQAKRINEVLREWGAVGFRSPCMYHNLEWMHDLDIEYDASTFDIDPFEPQPDGMHTLFPIYISNPTVKHSYVELPYTLPQDFTLFVLMRNRKTNIWEEKLDSIARNGGMALMLSHPDYMIFGGEKRHHLGYGVELYHGFLKHILSVYKGRYWHVLPRDIARFWADLFTSHNPQKSTR